MRPNVNRATVLALARALAVGAVGGALLQLTGLPLAWMLGPLLANLLVSMRGVDVCVPEGFRAWMLGVMGLVLGSRVTPQLAARILDWPLSVALLLAGVMASTAVAAAWYRRRGFDAVSAWFSAAPGAMSAMILTGERCGGDPRRIAVTQSLRVVLVILLLPPLFWALEDVDPVADAATPSLEDPWLLLLLPVLLPLGRWLRLPTPALLAPLLVAALMSGLDWARLSLPPLGMNLMLLVMGSAFGARFRGLSGARLKRYFVDGLVAALLALLVLSLFAEAIHQLVGVPRDVALLALAPGGIGELAILAVALDLDPIYVAFHHLVRMVALMFLAPFWARRLQRRADMPERHE
ncbi:AbrB family transcriptional regulator [Halomonas elongata]|uniref:AbrB family transcriptional regulator n=1 Tax=Halomonas elongata TaxID=2746 RepID=UPI0040339954